MRIGIMGGTFDPIHYGHLLIAESAADQFSLDKVFFMPTGHSPHKEDAAISSAKSRCDMIRLAIQDNPRFSLSLLEVESNETNYTYKTLERIKAEDANRDLFFVMGGDSLFHFETWRYPERIIKMATLLAAVRQDWNGEEFDHQIYHLTQCHGGKIYRLDTPNVSFSSHHIRQLVMEKKSSRYMLPNEVLDYIEEHKLYEIQND